MCSTNMKSNHMFVIPLILKGYIKISTEVPKKNHYWESVDATNVLFFQEMHPLCHFNHTL